VTPPKGATPGKSNVVPAALPASPVPLALLAPARIAESPLRLMVVVSMRARVSVDGGIGSK